MGNLPTKNDDFYTIFIYSRSSAKKKVRGYTFSPPY